MSEDDFSKYKYQNELSLSLKVRRLIWGIVAFLLFKPTPRWCLNNWRCFLLRTFGATIGKGCKLDPSCSIWAPWNLFLGDYVCFAQDVDCYNISPIHIASKVTVSQRSTLCTASHRIDTLTRELIHSPIKIDSHAWVCAECFIGPGVSVGEGSVIAACSVVMKTVGPWQVVGGNPAKFIKERVID